jgi:hypothetical protein
VTKRGAAIQGGLAAIGLLAAHLTWQREPERAPGAVAVIEAGKNDVARIHYDDEKNAFDLQRGSGANELDLHLVAKTAEPQSPNPKADAKAAVPPPRDLVVGESGTKLWSSFAPFVSPRAFGVLDAGKLKELGLAAPTRHLEVTVKGDVRRFEIGQPDKAPGGEAFLRDARDGRVYLLPRGLLVDLQNPSHMVDRRIHVFELADCDRIVLSSAGKQKDYLQVDRDRKGQATFALPKSPDKHDQMAKNWHDALWRAFPSEVLGRGEEPPGGKPSVVVRVDYYDGKSSLGFIELARAESATGTSEAAGESDVYARSEHGAGWMKLSTGAGLIADAQKLIAQ